MRKTQIYKSLTHSVDITTTLRFCSFLFVETVFLLSLLTLASFLSPSYFSSSSSSSSHPSTSLPSTPFNPPAPLPPYHLLLLPSCSFCSALCSSSSSSSF